MLYANWLTRAAGYVVDALVPAPFLIPAWILEDRQDDYGLTYFVLGIIGFAIHAYNRWFLAGRTGQSWGRRLVNIRLVSVRTGRPIGAGRAFLRDLAHCLDDLIISLGYLFPLCPAKRQTIAAMFTKTAVVK